MVAALGCQEKIWGGGIPDATAPAGMAVVFGRIDMMRAEQEKIAEYWVSSNGDHLIA